MRSALRWSRTRMLQISMLALLAICFAQVLWWYVDQRTFTAQVTERTLDHYRVDLAAADDLIATGVPPAAIELRFPHIRIVGKHAYLEESVAAGLADDEESRLRRYAWEGGFFLAVLLFAMWILWQTIRQEADLRRRQQNFIAAVSHELKSPLASLRLTTETMALRGPDPERREKLLGRLLDDLSRMDDMVGKLLDASRLERGRFELHPEPMELGQVVDEALRHVDERARLHRVEIENRVVDEVEIHADPVAAATVVRNLLENAVKATAAAGGGTVTVRARRDERTVHLEIQDTGIGFDPAEGKKLFDKFYRPGDEMRREVRSAGTGLGLYIVERLMRGRVKAESEGPGRGATFDVWWPEAEGRP